MEKIKQWMYYIVIGIVSLIALCFLPMVGSTVGLGWNLPNTVVGWLVWILVKAVVAALNVTIFHCFMLQAKINIADNTYYKEARDILRLIEDKEFIPRSPAEWTKKQYGQKGVTIFITTGLSTIALTQAVLSFDWISMLSYLFTIIMGLIFGIFQMKTAEEYWTNEFWQYAQKTKKDMDLAKTEHTNKRDDTSCDNSRSDILESSMADSSISYNPRSVVLNNNDSDNSVLGGAIYSSSSTSDSINVSTKETI